MDSCIGTHTGEAGKLLDAYLKGTKKIRNLGERRQPRVIRGEWGPVEPIEHLGSPGVSQISLATAKCEDGKNVVANGETE
jgi:hypothetical protein